MLVFEDLHWAGESTCRLLKYLADRLQKCPVLLIGTYRDTDLDPTSFLSQTIQELTRERQVAEIELSQLDEAQVSILLERQAGQRPLTNLVSLFFKATRGNPFYIEELYRHLDASKKLLKR